MNDLDYMKRAIRLARRGSPLVSPNPRVGCVVVRQGRIISEGYHAAFSGPHAEQAALAGLNPSRSRGATLYVTLEPCNHFGKTPPCTDAILAAKIGRVVIGCRDPNPVVSGRGIRRLRGAGIEVCTGILEEECRDLNRAFFKFIRTGLPHITLKIALTLDGKIAARNGNSKWISHEPSRRMVHRLRGEHDAVLVGIRTVLADDPELTVRKGPGGRTGAFSPKRIVLDSRLRIPARARLLSLSDPEKTIIATTVRAPAARKAALERIGARVWTLRTDRHGMVSLRDLLKKMAGDGITSVLVEGGSSIFTSFIKAGELDRMIVFTSPKLLGTGLSALGDLGALSPQDALRFGSFEWRRCGSDMMFIGEKPCLPASSKR